MSLRALLTDGMTSLPIDDEALGMGAVMLASSGMANPTTLSNAAWQGQTFRADVIWQGTAAKLEIDEASNALSAMRLTRPVPDDFFAPFKMKNLRQISELTITPFAADTRFAGVLSVGVLDLGIIGRHSAGRVRLGLDCSAPPRFADLAPLTGAGADGDLASLPAPLAKAMQVEVAAATFTFDLDKAIFVDAVLELALNTDWQILPGHSYPVLEKITARLEIAQPLAPDQRFATVDLGGELRLTKSDGPKIVAGVQWPDWRVTADMQDGPLPIAELLEGFGLPKVPNAGDITTLSMAATPTGPQKSLTIKAEVADLPPIQNDGKEVIRFDRVGLSIGWSQAKFAASLDADMVLGDTIGLQASVDFRNGDWQINAVLNDTTVGFSLEDATQALSKPLGAVVELPSSLAKLTLVDLDFDADLAGSGLSFRAVASDGDTLRISLELRARKTDTGWKITAEGSLVTDGVHFDLVLDDGRLIIVLSDDVPPRLTPAQLGDALGLNGLPDTPAVTFNAATGALAPGAAPIALIGLDLGAGFDLSGLPMVGNLLGEAAVEMQLLAWSGTPDDPFIEAINTRLPPNVTPLPEASKLGNSPATRMLIKAAGDVYEINVPVAPDEGGQDVIIENTALGAPASDGLTWKEIDKTLGALHLRRIGVKFEHPKLTLLIDASLALGPVTANLFGFGAELTLRNDVPYIEADPQLTGFGLEYRKGDIVLSGALINKGEGHFTGLAQLSLPEMGLAALGDYQEIDGRKSLFVYGVLDRALGGPAFFFVTGLAAGFGLHRKLALPALDKVADFPLVAAANGRPAADLLADLDAAVPPQLDTNFGAVGIKFTSFKLINGFVLIALQAGKDVEFDVLGLADTVLPPDTKSTPVAKIEIAIRASYRVSEGVLRVEAALTPASFLFAKACRLRGGFAFYAWFKDETVSGETRPAGDFVATLGGYHSKFVVPKGYPTPARVTITWPVTSKVTIKGDLYCALTSGGIMAGGHVKATFHDGAIQAGFETGLDFLMMWKPFHYDFSVHIRVWGSYTYTLFGTHTISIDIGADLHVWGPEFAGTAHVSLYIVSFDIPLGRGGKPKVKKLSWAAFQKAFLPDDVVTLRIVEGGVAGSVEPGALRLVCEAAVPASKLKLSTAVQGGQFAEFGVPPMDISMGQSGTHLVRVTMQNLDAKMPKNPTADLGPDVSASFELTPRTKTMPAGLWGAPGNLAKPSLTDAARKPITGLLAGADIAPKPATKTGISAPAPLKNFLLSRAAENTVALGDGGAKHLKIVDRDTAKAAMSAQVQARDAVVAAFQVKAFGLDPLPDYADTLRATPRVRI